MNIVIAERELMLDGEPLMVRLFAPRLDEEHGNGTWACDFQISWRTEQKRTTIYGVDSYQALVLAMRIIPTMIEASDAVKAGRLSWLDHPLDGAGDPPWSIEGTFGLRAIGGVQRP